MRLDSSLKADGKLVADARLRTFDTKRGWQLGTLAPALVLAICAIVVARSWQNIASDGTSAISIDFAVFWSAAKLAYAGNPLAAFDTEQLILIHGMRGDMWMPWLYPPSFLVAIVPLGAFSFPVAWLIFLGLSVLAMLAAVRPFTGGITPVWIGLTFAPAMLPALVIGQNSILWIAGLLAALAALRNDRQIMAGVLIGFLTLKPQLGVLIPVALLACFAWRTIAAAIMTTVFLVAVSTLIMGVEYWTAMNDLAQRHFGLVREVAAENNLMISLYSVLAGLGIPEPWALAAQWIVTGLAAATVAVAWYSPRVDFDLRAATLLLAIMISSPYFWHYESAILAPAALFLFRAGVLTTNRPGYVLGILMWLGAAPATLVILMTDITALSVRFTFAPIALTACLTCFFAVIHRLRIPNLPEFNNEVT